MLRADIAVVGEACGVLLTQAQRTPPAVRHDKVALAFGGIVAVAATLAVLRQRQRERAHGVLNFSLSASIRACKMRLQRRT